MSQTAGSGFILAGWFFMFVISEWMCIQMFPLLCPWPWQLYHIVWLHPLWIPSQLLCSETWWMVSPLVIETNTFFSVRKVKQLQVCHINDVETVLDWTGNHSLSFFGTKGLNLLQSYQGVQIFIIFRLYILVCATNSWIIFLKETWKSENGVQLYTWRTQSTESPPWTD